MNIAVFPMGMMDLEHPGQAVTDIAGAGFEEMVLDLSLCGSPYEWESEDMFTRLEPMLDKCAAVNLCCSVAVAPYLPRDTTQREQNRYDKDQYDENRQDRNGHNRNRYNPNRYDGSQCSQGQYDRNRYLSLLVQESLRICEKTGCKYLVVKPLSEDKGDADESVWERNHAFYLRLAPFAGEHGVMLLLENQCRDINGHLVRGVCSDAEEAAAWVDRLNEEAGEQRFGFCMDTGVCSLCGQNMYEFSVTLGHRLKAVILRDCDGSRENAMLPFTCVNNGQSRTDWLNLIRGLRRIGFSGEMLLNLTDTAAAFSPLLRPELLRLSRAVAEYLGWQTGMEALLKKYPSRVLFGAGNMCRNYMKCYGEQYPPLYTCDNNRALWGTIFCGLEVKPPQELCHLPADCAVFICNIYYREIEKQLRAMNIKNPVEFFNDEYMPSFYFDRLENGKKQ